MFYAWQINIFNTLSLFYVGLGNKHSFIYSGNLQARAKPSLYQINQFEYNTRQVSAQYFV